MDIFNRNVSELAGVFTSDRAKLLLKGNLGVLVQQMNFTYAQTITRLYEVGANGPDNASFIYYIGGRTQGNLAINRVIGPKGSVCAMYAQYGDVCKAPENILRLTLTETDCRVSGGGTSRTTYTMFNCVITQVGVAVAAQDMIINENTTMMFSSLACNGNDSSIGQAGGPGIIN